MMWQERQRFYTSLLRRLYKQTRYVNNPDLLAYRINQRLAKINDGELIRSIIRQRFTSGGTSGGFSWPGLAVATQKQRQAQGFGASGPILIRSEFLLKAATEGTLRVTSEAIYLEFKDGAAPRYIGNEQAKRRKIITGAAMAMDRARALGMDATGYSGRLSDYVDRLNERRPFYGLPQDNELVELFAARDRIIANIQLAIANGLDVDQMINATE